MSARVFVGWKLPDESRARLLARFAPRYGRLLADHVTLSDHAGAQARPPLGEAGEVIGEADDGAGAQALVVRVGTSERRPDGGTFHITWSLGEGREAVESNAVIAAHGWRRTEPTPIALRPVRLERDGEAEHQPIMSNRWPGMKSSPRSGAPRYEDG